jgi:hypothetical protein
MRNADEHVSLTQEHPHVEDRRRRTSCHCVRTLYSSERAVSSVDSDPKAVQKCKGMTGVALENCTREARPVGKNDDSTSQANCARPGASPNAAQPPKGADAGDAPRKK